MTLSSEEIRKRFLDFFLNREHTLIPSASLVPQDDPSVLFTTAGMQPLVPYLLGEPHPQGKRLVNYQRCVRTNDIEEVGDSTHLTFFEMLGNWSLGDYFKEDTIRWSYQLLTHPEEGFGLDPARLYISVFAGNDTAPRDDESAALWQELGIPSNHIFYLTDNWWPDTGDNDTSSGPCGPDTEMFYDLTENGVGELADADTFEQATDDGRLVEIWNDVFMQYKKENGKITEELATRNVDTGSGFERLTAVLQGKTNVFETDLFAPIISAVTSVEPEQSTDNEEADCVLARRIIADHTRATVFIINDGVEPANTDAGYILRRLMRRAVQYADSLDLPSGALSDTVAKAVIEKYSGVYPTLVNQEKHICNVISEEEGKFRKTLQSGLKELQKRLKIEKKHDGAISIGLNEDDLFDLYATHGFPVEMSLEIIANKYNKEVGVDISQDILQKLTSGFYERMKKHQEKSKAGGQQRFKGGLAGGGSKMELRYHTATHLLNAALREVLGDQVSQKGSNVTEDRLRFDFNYPEKLTDEQKTRVEELVNAAIERELPVTSEELPLQEAYDAGAIGVFGEQYPENVKVYTIGDQSTGVYSKEICGGPHVENTAELEGTFTIKKEGSVSAGVRRIKAILQDS